MEAAVKEAEAKLAKQEVEAASAISAWEARLSELQTKNTELTKSLEESSSRSKELADENDMLVSSQAQLQEKEAALLTETERVARLKGKLCSAGSFYRFVSTLRRKHVQTELYYLLQNK